MSPRATVMIPVYNGALNLPETIQSLEAQTFKDFEVIFADDKSEDDSLELLSAFAAKDHRVRVLSLQKNLGDAPKVLNEIIKHSRGDYLVYSSQDDLYSPDWIERMVTRADETGADAVIPDLVFLGLSSPSLVGVHGDRSVVLTNREAVTFALDTVIPGNALLRASVVKKIMYPNIGAWADAYASKLFFLSCNKVAFCDGVFYYRRGNPEAITQKISTKIFDAPMADIFTARMLRDNDFDPRLTARMVLRAFEQVFMLSAYVWPVKTDDQRMMEAKIREYLEIFASQEIADMLAKGGLSARDKFLRYGATNRYGVFRLALVVFNAAKVAKTVLLRIRR